MARTSKGLPRATSYAQHVARLRPAEEVTEEAVVIGARLDVEDMITTPRVPILSAKET